MMMMMKSPVTMATCLLLFSSLAILVKEISGSHNPNLCCFGFSSTPLITSQVVRVHKTEPLCPMEGVIFVKKKGKKLERVCVEPSQEWVKNIMMEKENQKPVRTRGRP
ncbi:C-C motif chemokine 4-like [Austrofundulus limnaeus]|uniref:C-C motif chemokine 4-like n=1 Tax=Austrofundulus limnaeus TaxID=52670 RepID=A0A2I4BHY8_AUSLI|nr:PREDICTED: C-C motif chemokine 4-like [Austrofundulus limnaeus]